MLAWGDGDSLPPILRDDVDVTADDDVQVFVSVDLARDDRAGRHGDFTDVDAG